MNTLQKNLHNGLDSIFHTVLENQFSLMDQGDEKTRSTRLSLILQYERMDKAIMNIARDMEGIVNP